MLPSTYRSLTSQGGPNGTQHLPNTPSSASFNQPSNMHVKRFTLTSKKNWWMVEMDEDELPHTDSFPFQPSEQPQEPSVVQEQHYQDYIANHQESQTVTVHRTEGAPEMMYNPPRHPTSIFSFPTPTAYAAPPNPTGNLQPLAQGGASEVFKCVVKKPDVITLDINGEIQSNASDVTTQFLAELRVYTTVSRHRNIAAFLGCLENVGMVLEFVEGRSLYEVVIARPPLTRPKKIDYANQLLAGLTHLHQHGLSHGDLSLLNIQVTHSFDTIKLLDFGRSVSAYSTYRPPHDEPDDPFTYLQRPNRGTETIPLPSTKIKVEQIHPGTRPFSAPEVLRGECQDALLADAYSFGMIIVAIDRCESVDMSPWDQRKDLLPDSLFVGCEVFEERAREYLRRWDKGRRRLEAGDVFS